MHYLRSYQERLSSVPSEKKIFLVVAPQKGTVVAAPFTRHAHRSTLHRADGGRTPSHVTNPKAYRDAMGYSKRRRGGDKGPRSWASPEAPLLLPPVAYGAPHTSLHSSGSPTPFAASTRGGGGGGSSGLGANYPARTQRDREEDLLEWLFQQSMTNNNYDIMSASRNTMTVGRIWPATTAGRANTCSHYKACIHVDPAPIAFRIPYPLDFPIRPALQSPKLFSTQLRNSCTLTAQNMYLRGAQQTICYFPICGAQHSLPLTTGFVFAVWVNAGHSLGVLLCTYFVPAMHLLCACSVLAMLLPCANYVAALHLHTIRLT